MTIEWDKFSADVQNDSHLSVAEVRKLLEKDGVEIRYGDLAMLTQSHALQQARDHIADKDAETRQRMMMSVDRALREDVPKILKGKRFSKRRMDRTHADLCLWTALKEASAN